MNKEIQAVSEKLDRIIELLDKRKPGAKSFITKAGDSTDFTRQRVDVIETLFWDIVNAPRSKKQDAYKVPRVLLGDRDQPNIEAVVCSVLLNQASLRKVFKVIGIGDSHRESPLDRARRAVAASNLVILPMGRLRLGAFKETDVALSPGEARRLARVDCDLPDPKGWTTASRAASFEGPFGHVKAPADPCGARVWPGDAPVDRESNATESHEELDAGLEQVAHTTPAADPLEAFRAAFAGDDVDEEIEDVPSEVVENQPAEKKMKKVKISLGRFASPQ